jgi:hypothetical protein
LPACRVFIVSETMAPDGDANAGEPAFESTIVIAVSVIRGFGDPVALAGDIDKDVDCIETLLLTDPTFVRFGPDALFESITQIRRQRIYPQDGETYFAQLRLEMSFLSRVSYPPNIKDDFRSIKITGRPLRGLPNDEAILPVGADFDLPDEE